jgi:hypothetical protein
VEGRAQPATLRDTRLPLRAQMDSEGGRHCALAARVLPLVPRPSSSFSFPSLPLSTS